MVWEGVYWQKDMNSTFIKWPDLSVSLAFHPHFIVADILNDKQWLFSTWALELYLHVTEQCSVGENDQKISLVCTYTTIILVNIIRGFVWEQYVFPFCKPHCECAHKPLVASNVYDFCEHDCLRALLLWYSRLNVWHYTLHAQKYHCMDFHPKKCMCYFPVQTLVGFEQNSVICTQRNVWKLLKHLLSG